MVFIAIFILWVFETKLYFKIVGGWMDKAMSTNKRQSWARWEENDWRRIEVQ